MPADAPCHRGPARLPRCTTSSMPLRLRWAHASSMRRAGAPVDSSSDAFCIAALPRYSAGAPRGYRKPLRGRRRKRNGEHGGHNRSGRRHQATKHRLLPVHTKPGEPGRSSPIGVAAWHKVQFVAAGWVPDARHAASASRHGGKS
jgi:hypothetical protein